MFIVSVYGNTIQCYINVDFSLQAQVSEISQRKIAINHGGSIYTTETGKCDKSGSLPTSVFFWWKPIVKPLPASY